MAKTTYIAAGNGTSGQTGLQIRNILNDSFQGNTFNVPETFVWTGDLSAYANKVMLITYDHAISAGNITLPANCTLRFEGGKLLNIGTLTGNQSKIINITDAQIFSTVTFLGTWHSTIASPTWWGAIANSAVTVFTNDCSAAFQKALDSPFEIVVPNGFYYIASSIFISKPKTLYMGAEMFDNRDSIFTLEQDHVRLYTNQNIHIVNIRSRDVFLVGGMIDTTQAATHNKAAIRYDMNYKMWGGKITTSVLGLRATVRIEGLGTIAVLFDTDDLTVDYGYASMIEIYGTFNYCAKGVWIKPVSTSVLKQWCTDIKVDCQMSGCKKFVQFDDGGMSSIAGSFQPSSVLCEAEKDFSAIELNTNNVFVTAFVWDLNTTPQNGFYSHNTAVLNNGDNYFTGKAAHQLHAHIGSGIQRPSAPVNNLSNFVILNDRWNGKSFISRFDNQLSFIGKRASTSFTITAHQGTGYNFDANTSATAQPGSSNIVITNPTNLFNSVGLPPTITYNSSADIESDFVEIVINIDIILSFFYIYILEGYKPNRIQLIYKRTGFADVIDNRYPIFGLNTTKIYPTNFVTPQGINQIIIRLIGASVVDQSLVVSDIAGRRAVLDYNPVITCEGGQEILGELTMQKVKYTGTPVYADNTAAKAAGLVNGQTYRTSTGILMQVF